MDKHKKGGSRLEQYKIEKYKKEPRFTKGQKVLMAVAILLALAIVIVLAWKSVFVRPDVTKPSQPSASGSSGAVTDIIDYGDGVRPRAEGERKSKDYYTVLVLGRDTGGGGNTDTMLLASYDVTNQKASVMSIPRDTMVNVSWDVKKINSVYNVYGGGEKGLKALYKEISQLVGFEPDFEVIVEWDAVGQLVDAIGGVYFDVPYNMDYHDPYQDLVIEQAKGYRLLTGDDAMEVIRWRKNDANSPYGNVQVGDDGRIKIQQDFLMAVVKQLMKAENVKNISKIAKVFEDCVETDMSFQNILWFGQQALTGGLSTENINFFTMPYKSSSAWSRSYQQNLSYVVPDANALLKIVNEQLSPFKEVFTLSDLDIMYTNADGSVGSTSGHLEDAQAGKPPVKPVAKPETNEPSGESGEGGEGGGSIVIDPETGTITGEGSEGVIYDPETGVITIPGVGEVYMDPETGELTLPEGEGTVPPEEEEPPVSQEEEMTQPPAEEPAEGSEEPPQGESQEDPAEQQSAEADTEE